MRTKKGENYGSIFLMSINAKNLKKMLANLIQHVKKTCIP
jgi:hypothetical protein